jgi:hypothetical protein
MLTQDLFQAIKNIKAIYCTAFFTASITVAITTAAVLGFEVLTAVSMKIAVFWVVAQPRRQQSSAAVFPNREL